MALFNCPVCGKSISDKAVSCPGCGHPVQQVSEVPLAKKSGGKKAIAFVAIFAVLLCVVWAFFDSQQNKRISDSFDYGGSNYVPKTGNAGALEQPKSYIRSSAFSYTGLIEQLEYHGFSSSEAQYGADNCGADWKEQALRNAKSYLSSSAFS